MMRVAAGRVGLVAVAAILVFAGQAMAQGVLMPMPGPVPGEGIWPGGVGVPLELRSQKVEVTIEDQLATTRVEQVFYNGGSRAVEGEFLFPLPAEAHVDRFRMDVNGQMTDAELLDAEKARGIYEKIVRETRDPALLEYVGQQLLRARIFPIEARSEKTVVLEYSQLLKSDGGLVCYRYPLSERKVDGRAAQVFSMRVEVRTGRPLTTIYSPSHEVEVTRGGDHEAIIGMESTEVGAGDFELYFAAEEAGEAGLVAMKVMTYREDEAEEGYFLLLVSPGGIAGEGEALAKDVVFVLDSSGSMAGEKIKQAKRALGFCLENLNEGDRFEIIRFSTDAEAVFGKLSAVNEENRKEARKFIKDVDARGGTAIDAALRLCLEVAQAEDDARPRMVIFLTDGQPTVGNTNEEEIVEMVGDSAGGARVFCFGIGTDVNTHLLDKVAEVSRAATEYVLPEEDIEVKVSRFYEKISEPVLANLKLSVGGDVRATKLHPSALADLFYGEQLVVLGRYSGEGEAEIELAGAVANETVTLKAQGDFAGEAKEHLFIAQLWATRRVGFLLDEIRLRGESEELKEEVVALAREFGIVTPYTAYLIIEDEEGRGVEAARRSLRVLADNDAGRAVVAASPVAMEEKSGLGAVVVGQQGRSLREAGTKSAAARSNEYAYQAGRPARAEAEQRAVDVVHKQMQATQMVGGRVFVQNGAQWVDTLVQGQEGAEVVRVAFGSEAYFQLLRDHPEAAAWLSVGRDVQVVIGGRIYEIVDES
jgi:Ca-activated chloride channel family protein